tara:strand:- start:88 stop:654 length:567 start_codon:yes stop_codon:yes gene_type:complete
MMDKLFINAEQLLQDSFELAWQIYESGFRPNYIIGVWRGGAPIGIAVQELLDVLDVKSDHIAIRTSHYKGIGEHKNEVQVFGLNYMVKRIKSEDSLLIVDDVHDTGMSIDQIIFEIRKVCKKNTPQIKIATPYFKPSNNKTGRIPDFYLHESDQWLVFPHELEGLTKEEIKENKPQLAKLIEKIIPLL